MDHRESQGYFLKSVHIQQFFQDVDKTCTEYNLQLIMVISLMVSVVIVSLMV